MFLGNYLKRHSLGAINAQFLCIDFRELLQGQQLGMGFVLGWSFKPISLGGSNGTLHD